MDSADHHAAAYDLLLYRSFRSVGMRDFRQ
jgi:hypothetical protein